MDFGDLQNDKLIQAKLTNLHESVNKIEHMLEIALTKVPNRLDTVHDKVNYNLFLAYTLNTLYWLYLRTKGVDPNTNDIKGQLNRIRQYMVKAKEAHDRNTIRPTLNTQVAARFIKHGIHKESSDTVDHSPNKKKK